jgi:hypothetical protein
MGVRRGCVSSRRGKPERGRPDGTVTDGTENKAYIAGVTIIEVPSREEALQWAAKIAAACRCAQEVREFAPDPAVGN